MKQILILLTILLFNGCGGHIIKAPLVEKLQPYKETQVACDKLLRLDIDKNLLIVQECHSFSTELYKVNAQFAVSHDKDRGNFTETRNNINFAKVNKVLHKKYETLLKVLPQEAKKAMQESDEHLVKAFLDFPTQGMNQDYYDFFAKYPSHYNEAHFYIDYQEKLANNHLKEAKELYKQNKKRAAFKKLQQSASMDNHDAIKLLAERYAVNKKYNSAIKWYKKIAGSDTYAIDLELAKLYEIQKKYKKAFYYYQKSAITLDAFSEYKVYTLLSEEKVKETEIDTAESWLARSARHGYLRAQYLYGLEFVKKEDYKSALTWLQQAADAQYSDAYTPLGELYFKQALYDESFKYLNLGTLNANACYNLAYMYEHAKGTTKNYQTAYELYMQAQKMAIDKKDIDKDILRVHTAIMRPIKEKAARIAKEKELIEEEQLRVLLLAKEEKKKKEEKIIQLALAEEKAQQEQQSKQLATAQKNRQDKIAKLKKECPLAMTQRRYNYKMAGVLVGSVIDQRDGNYIISDTTSKRRASYYVSGFNGEELYRGTDVHWRVQSKGESYTYTGRNGADITIHKVDFLPADNDPCSPYVENTQE